LESAGSRVTTTRTVESEFGDAKKTVEEVLKRYRDSLSAGSG